MLQGSAGRHDNRNNPANTRTHEPPPTPAPNPAADLASGAVTTLVSDADFYACPRLSPDGSR